MLQPPSKLVVVERVAILLVEEEAHLRDEGRVATVVRRGRPQSGYPLANAECADCKFPDQHGE